jgi:N-acetylmuramoyl-L-alanine amidase
MTERFLTVNPYSRPGRLLKSVTAIVLHWTASPKQDAGTVWDFFEKTCPKTKHYSSAHYIIGQNGNIIHAIPNMEVAYHVGSSQKDPESGKIYTDLARAVFREYASYPDKMSPNQCSIGIELCPLDDIGTFSAATLEAARDLVRDLMKSYGIPINHVLTHNAIVGWKDCPRLWVTDPDKFETFKRSLV